MEPNDDKTQTHIVLSKGTIVSHYRIIGKIGAGGMGEVYLAQDTELDRKVALKFLPQHLCQDEDCRKRFKREAQAAAKLSHPNIVTIHEVGEHESRPYFVMEHVEGRSLRDVKAEELDIDRIIGIAIQLCDGLHSAHAAGVIHRDIKPSNIIIDSSGRPKLLDFGLATVKGGEHLTKTGSTLGTVGYMSPEQIEGKTTDARSDLFSLGVVLYELIANKSPFRRDNETAILKAILHDTPEPLARYKSGVPDDFQRIITKLLEKDPSLRYQSAAGVIPDLKKFSSASTAAVAIVKKRDRWNQYVVPSTVIILLAVVAIWYFGYRDRSASQSGSDDRIMLVVLPFQNLGDPEDEYFADGITDEITSRLFAVHALSVISRTTAHVYKKSDKSIPDIAKELGVDYILEGTVRWSKADGAGRVQITPQLIDASTDSRIWSDRYQQSVVDVFAAQAAIAEEVVNALSINLAQTEKLVLQNQPISHPDAYALYLLGRQNRIDYQFEKAEDYLLQALALDSTFASAWSELSLVYSRAAASWRDRSAELSRKALEAANTALILAPDQPHARMALGYYYYRVEKAFDKAASEIELVQQSLPGDAQSYHILGLIKRRAGQWDAALKQMKESVRLDPLNTRYLVGLSMTSLWMRDTVFSSQAVARALTTDPDDLRLRLLQANTIFYLQGDTAATSAILADVDSRFRPAKMDGSAFQIYSTLSQLYLEMGRGKAMLNLQERLKGLFDSKGLLLEYNAGMAEALYLIGDSAGSDMYYDSCLARTIELLSEDLTPESRHIYRRFLALVHAHKNQMQEARRILDQELNSEVVASDAILTMNVEKENAVLEARFGDPERAVRILETLIEKPFFITRWLLLYDPSFDRLRDHPRFKALLDKHETEN